MSNPRKTIKVFLNREYSITGWRKAVRSYLLNIQNGYCAYCGLNLLPGRQSHIDHIIPASDGGTDELDNLALVCRFCNMAKQALPLDALFAWFSHIRSEQFFTDKRHQNR